MLPTNVVSKKGSASGSLSLALALAIGSRVESRESPRCVAGIKYVHVEQAGSGKSKEAKNETRVETLGENSRSARCVCVCV